MARAGRAKSNSTGFAVLPSASADGSAQTPAHRGCRDAPWLRTTMFRSILVDQVHGLTSRAKSGSCKGLLRGSTEPPCHKLARLSLNFYSWREMRSPCGIPQTSRQTWSTDTYKHQAQTEWGWSTVTMDRAQTASPSVPRRVHVKLAHVVYAPRPTTRQLTCQNQSAHETWPQCNLSRCHDRLFPQTFSFSHSINTEQVSTS